MMVQYSANLQLPRINPSVSVDRRGKVTNYSDSVYAFDTETTTFFQVGGVWKSEKYTTQEERKNATDTLGIVYIWACRFKGMTVYGRTRKEFINFLGKLDNINPERKVFYVHNMNYDYSFFSDFLIPDYCERSPMLARAKMSPLKIKTFMFNMELRDSYALNNMSLGKVGEAYNCGKKLKGDLDYTEQRLPVTPLSQKELDYVEHDVDVLYEYMESQWLNTPEYNRDFGALPLTQTGVPRRICKNLLNADEKHRKKMSQIAPTTVEEYYNLREPFAGGVAHANYLYTTTEDNQNIVKNVKSADRASSYPTEMVTRKFPSSKFIKMQDMTNIDIYEENHVYIMLVKFTGLRQRTAWDYISYSKCHSEPVNAIVDNGRIACADEVTIKLTNIDMRIINNVYDYDDCEIIEAYVATADYLPKPFVELVLELYGNKTKLKKSDPALYMRSKQILNSLYGMLCTDICKEDIYLDDGCWTLEYDLMRKSDGSPDNIRIAKSMTDKLRSNKPFLPYSAGVFITAYAREQLFDPILHYDPSSNSIDGIANDAVYTDTDSVKFINPDDNIKFIEDYNKRMMARLHKAAQEQGIPFENFAPLDPSGVAHPLGVFEADGFYDEFVTMGSKKYCYNIKQEDGSMKFGYTVAGLQKTYVDATGEHKTMHSMNEMKPGIHIPNARTNYVYSTNQQLAELTDYLGNKYTNDYLHGVSMWRTDYTFSLANDYAELLNDDMLDLWESKCFNKLSSPLAQIAKWREENYNGEG